MKYPPYFWTSCVMASPVGHGLITELRVQWCRSESHIRENSHCRYFATSSWAFLSPYSDLTSVMDRRSSWPKACLRWGSGRLMMKKRRGNWHRRQILTILLRIKDWSSLPLHSSRPSMIMTQGVETWAVPVALEQPNNKVDSAWLPFGNGWVLSQDFVKPVAYLFNGKGNLNGNGGKEKFEGIAILGRTRKEETCREQAKFSPLFCNCLCDRRLARPGRSVEPQDLCASCAKLVWHLGLLLEFLDDTEDGVCVLPNHTLPPTRRVF